MKSFIIVIILLGLGIGSVFFWFKLLGSPPSRPSPGNGEFEWAVLQDLIDGYSIEYPVGLAWGTLSYTNSGSVHTLRISGKDAYEGTYFTMFINITPDERAEFAETLAKYAEPFGEPKQTTFRGQEATQISSPQETHYIFTRSNAVWVVSHPQFVEPQKKEIADRILGSLTLLTSEQITEHIQQNTQIQQMKLRDEMRKAALESLQTMLHEYFRANGRYPIAKTEDRIFKGKESLSFLYSKLQSLSSISYRSVPGDPREDFYYRYVSPNGTSYVLTAQLEHGEESDCDRSLTQDVCILAVRPH